MMWVNKSVATIIAILQFLDIYRYRCLGPFRLLVLASKGLQEYTAVFYRIFKGQNKYAVLMCSDQSRCFSISLFFKPSSSYHSKI